jgi:small subunit ribosomal protein S6
VHEYELMYILHPRLTADEATAAIERVNERVGSSGGSVLSVDNWGRRRLAYPISHHLEGTYVLTTMEFPPEATNDLEASLRISEDVIRHLLIRGIIAYEGPPVQEERGRSSRPTPSEAEDTGAAQPAAAQSEGTQAEAAPPERAPTDEAQAEAAPPAATESEAAEGGEPEQSEPSADAPSTGGDDAGSESGPEAEGERAGGSAE